jgi:hypothetical protein
VAPPPRLRRGSLALVPSLPIPSPSASLHTPSRRFDPSSSYRIVAQHRKKLLRFPSVPLAHVLLDRPGWMLLTLEMGSVLWLGVLGLGGDLVGGRVDCLATYLVPGTLEFWAQYVNSRQRSRN